MRELGELNNHISDFAGRGVRIVAVSVDDQEQTAQTQGRFPNLIVLGDPERKMTAAFEAIHAHAGPHGADIAAPTTFILDRAGRVRRVIRAERIIVRLTPAELLAEVNASLPAP
jgi:peroxiredoxin